MKIKTANKSKKKSPSKRKAIYWAAGEGRNYPMGRIRAVFKADGPETKNRISISEWWLDPHTQGPGPHSHEEDDIYVVIEGTMSFRIGRRWVHARHGSFVLVPGGMVHDFQNRGSRRAGVLNFLVPGGFEKNMPDVAKWYAEHPPGKA